MPPLARIREDSRPLSPHWRNASSEIGFPDSLLVRGDTRRPAATASPRKVQGSENRSVRASGSNPRQLQLGLKLTF
jgi:hypothetical protein